MSSADFVFALVLMRKYEEYFFYTFVTHSNQKFCIINSYDTSMWGGRIWQATD